MGNLFPPKVSIWEILTDDTSVMVTARSMRMSRSKTNLFNKRIKIGFLFHQSG